MRAPDPFLAGLARFAVTAVLLGTLAVVFEESLVALALPVFEAFLTLIDTTFRTVELSIVHSAGELFVQRLATPSHSHVLGGKVILADPSSQVSTRIAAGIVLQPLVITAALLTAWPWVRTVELVLRLAIGVPMLLILLLVDVPLTLYGFAWYKEVDLLDPERVSALITWADFMNVGGRFAMSLLVAAMATIAAPFLTRPGDSSSRQAPCA